MSGVAIVGIILASLFLAGLVGMALSEIDNVGD